MRDYNEATDFMSAAGAAWQRRKLTTHMDGELASKVIGIVALVKQVSPDSIRADSTFDELGIDSLDRINILFELENEFDIDVPDDEARSIRSVQGIIDRLAVYVQGRESKGE